MKNLLTRRDDFLFPIEAHFNKIFDQLLLGSNSLKDTLKSSQGYPKMDVLENGEHLMVRVAIPGLKNEDVVVEHNASNPPEVTISGKTTQFQENGEGTQYYVKELRQSAFKRTLLLPEYATEEPDAVLEDGILTLKWNVPTTNKEPSMKRVTVRQPSKNLEIKSD